VSLGADPESVSAGGKTTLSGRLEMSGVGGLSGKKVVIEARPEGETGWQAVPDGTLTTGEGGSFSLPNVSPTKTTDYRAVFAGQPGLGLGGSTSPASRVEVTAVSLSLSPSAPEIVFGQSVALSGNLAFEGNPLSGRRVILEMRPNGAAGYTRVPGQPTSGLLTNTAGNFRLTGVKPSKNTDYRATFAGGSGVPAARSEPSRVGVKAALSINTSLSSFRLGRPVTISGDIKPARGGAVTLIVNRAGSQVLSEELTLANSRYSFRYTPAQAGTYTVRAVFAGDADHLGNSSPEKSFRVTR
jgi:manganese oxidase